MKPDSFNIYVHGLFYLYSYFFVDPFNWTVNHNTHDFCICLCLCISLPFVFNNFKEICK